MPRSTCMCPAPPPANSPNVGAFGVAPTVDMPPADARRDESHEQRLHLCSLIDAIAARLNPLLDSHRLTIEIVAFGQSVHVHLAPIAEPHDQ